MEKPISLIKKSGSLSVCSLFEMICCQASEYFFVRTDVSYKMANSLGQDFSIILKPCGSSWCLFQSLKVHQFSLWLHPLHSGRAIFDIMS